MTQLQTVAIAGLRLSSASRSHVGCRRAINEDRVLDRADAGLWAVADGMGGHHAGDVAATRVIAAIDAVMRDGSGYAYFRDMLDAVERVNAALFADRTAAGASGATLVALMAHEDHLACLWAGDSRAYRQRAGMLDRLTRDHSVVQHLIDRALIDESARRSHPQATTVTRAVGAAATLDIERRFAPIAVGDRYLLCSDGLTACLDDADIGAILARGDPAAAADALLAAALDRGAPDNVSLVVIDAA